MTANTPMMASRPARVKALGRAPVHWTMKPVIAGPMVPGFAARHQHDRSYEAPIQIREVGE
jgi:hypothetical protein